MGKIGVVGLGKMGHGVASRLLKAGHEVVVYNRTYEKSAALAADGAQPVRTLEELVQSLPTPRVVWTYLPSGTVTRDHHDKLIALLSHGDFLLDGGNSDFHDSRERGIDCQARGINWVDVGTSGGISGAEEGYCLMIGAEQEAFDQLKPYWEAVAQSEGYARVGAEGAGHYVKMVHNAIEYGMLQAFAEGIDLIQSGSLAGQIDITAATDVWRHGSIISSRIGDWTHQSVAHPDLLSQTSNRIEDNGMARWTIEEAITNGVPLPSITSAVYARFVSQRDVSPANRLISAIRHLFGGHSL